MNLKEEFTKWFFENANGRYSALKEYTVRDDMEHSNKLLDRDIFQVDETNYRNMVEYLREELYKKGTEFDLYSDSISNHRPRAILGKENYIKFLEEKFSNRKLSNALYTMEEKEKLEKFYNQLEDKYSFKLWLHWASMVVRDLNIKHPEFKAIITRENEAILLLGMKPLLTFRELEGKSIWGFILTKDFLEKNKSSLPVFEISEFSNVDSKNYVLGRFFLKTFQNLTPDFINNFFDSAKEEYGHITQNKFSDWNEEASASNNALKHVLFNDENIENWFKDIKRINLKTQRLYKLSMGTFYKTRKFIKNNLINDFLFQSIGVMHENTGHGQGERFKKEAEVGDYLYVTYGKDKLGGLYQISSGYEKLNEILEKLIDEQGYISRQLEKVKSPLKNHTRDLRSDTRAWMPSGNTTFVEVTDLQEANRVLFKPYYDVEFSSDQRTSLKQQNSLKIDNTMPINRILYGPPGTGKTYYSKELAVNLANPGFSIDNISSSDVREQINEEYERLYDLGQIVFTTFHQSFSYEDFVEGIKPLPPKPDGEVGYEVQKGIFKSLCDLAMEEKESFNFDEAYQTYTEDITEKGSIELETPVQKRPFKVHINSNGTSVATPRTEKATEMGVTRDMLWDYIVNDKIREWKPYTTAIGDYVKEHYGVQVEEVNNRNRNYVLIIDEINRGNVSSIFGELITLLEQDKRLGNKEEIKVRLPYSKNDFGIPNNLHIIGTMNTADRSVEALDTALRRRFVFEEIMPQPELLRNIKFERFTLEELLTTINNRLEALLDRDHTIGHSYFIKITSGDTKELQSAFENKILPLLQEYFYHDYEKIALILGEGFIERKEGKVSFARFAKTEAPEVRPSFLLREVKDIEKAVLNLLNRGNEAE